MTKREIVYSQHYYVNIGDHVFPTKKYRLIHDRLIKEGILKEEDFVSPKIADEEDVLLVHTSQYLEKLRNSLLTREEVLKLELPFSKELLKSSLFCCGGTILASEIAIKEGVGIHLGGGFHHAFPEHGEGFCVLNDIAIAIKRAMRKKLINKALVIDCDLHHGNGTAAIFRGDKSVFTFSIHQENNYPFFKPPSNLDIGLADGAKDKEYFGFLSDELPKIASDFKPDLIMYVAGADPYKDDQIGGLCLTIEGLRKRDEFVFGLAKNYNIPIAVVLAGGYAYKYEDTVEIHYNTIMAALNI
ncbi:MAG: histone deacetylase [Candidatus Omnitrophica bacterium CG07_land_8_20_14_0_80_42_15]|uniref:Histone deacetylase n=1 Tax=Candidatus Aquitaenariimonas noxiae TaxID=1974741 RepID=A0A2J0KRY8_9BACT|nr:MAG: histone deacetylase [Candidatus Omnitrophica bacterium CG07_land_8_20_14_0_80_42_15]